MSQYEELTTTMTDQQYLIEALTEMGYKPEAQTEGTALRGYGGVSWNRPVQVTIPTAWPSRAGLQRAADHGGG